MYTALRPWLFRLDPERAHHLALRGLHLAQALRLDRLLGPGPAGRPVDVLGLRFPNAVGLAAGMDKDAVAVDALGRFGFGFIEVGTVTPRAQDGNPRPRLFRLPEHEAIINRMGFNNQGMDVLAGHLARRRYRGVLGVNIGKNKDTPNDTAAEDYLLCLRRVYDVADYIAVNLSSPNTPNLRELQEDRLLGPLVRQLRTERDRLAATSGVRRPLVVKLAPDLDDDTLVGLGRLLRDEGMDGIIAVNTTVGRTAVDGHRFALQAGGLSGRPLRERAQTALQLLRQAVGPDFPLIGVGGIGSVEDARARLAAGADLIQIYTALVYQGPRLVRDLASQL